MEIKAIISVPVVTVYSSFEISTPEGLTWSLTSGDELYQKNASLLNFLSGLSHMVNFNYVSLKSLGFSLTILRSNLANYSDLTYPHLGIRLASQPTL